MSASDYVKIENYAAKDTLVEGDPNKLIKGSELDAEFVAIAASSALKAPLISPNLTGVPKAPNANLGTNTTQIATTAFVMANSVPVGGIIMWSGLIANIATLGPWALCDGTNGTPDLRGKFIIGAGGSYSPAATGGSAAVTLLEANLPAHTHVFTGTTSSSGGHSHTITDPGHTHTTYCATSTGSGSGPTDAGDNLNYLNVTSSSQTTGITISTAPSHTHDVTGTNANTGSGTALNILPPYLALAYIMRTA